MNLFDCSLRGAFLLPMIAAVALPPAVSRAADALPAVKVETVVGGLDNPLAIAIRPSDGELFVSESGAGRLVRIAPGKDAKPQPAITGFPVGPSPELPELRVGPLGLAFTASDNLVVGSGGQGPGTDAVRLFSLPRDNKPLTLDDALRSLTVKPGTDVIRSGSGSTKPDNDIKTGEGWYYGVTTVPYAIFAASRGGADAGWISRSSILRPENGKTHEIVLDLRPFIEGSRQLHTAGPTALAVNRQGELVVGQVGKFDKSHSMLSFYDPSNSKLLLNLPTDLLDIMGLAYSPQTGQLYAVDLAWSDAKQGGLFRLDATQTAGAPGVKAIKIASLDRPTSLAFAPDGTLYITTLGPAKGEPVKKSGQLQKIPPGL